MNVKVMKKKGVFERLGLVTNITFTGDAPGVSGADAQGPHLRQEKKIAELICLKKFLQDMRVCNGAHCSNELGLSSLTQEC